MREENIEKMDFKELRKEVQLLRDELAIFKRKYEDAIYNLDSDNFGKSFTIAQDNMKAQIQITADALKSTVTKTDLATELTQYSTIEQTAEKIEATVNAEYVNSLIGNEYVANGVLETKLIQTYDSILQSVSYTYETKNEAETKKTTLESSIETSKNGILATVSGEYQTKSDAEGDYKLLKGAITSMELTVDSLTSTVSKNISAYFESAYDPNEIDTTEEQKTMLCLYAGTYYYFNDIASEWEEYPVDGITTMFKQTASGFELTGNVSISGDFVSGGTIKGTALMTTDGKHTLKMVNDSGNGYGTFQLISNYAGSTNKVPYFSVYSDDQGTLWLYAYGEGFLSVDDTGVLKTVPYGTWNFEECSVENLIVPARFG